MISRPTPAASAQAADATVNSASPAVSTLKNDTAVRARVVACRPGDAPGEALLP